MSTRNINAVLECLRNGIAPLADGQLLHDAVKEIEAIERAAKALKTAYVGEIDGGASRADLNTAHDLMAAIADDAP